MYALARNSWKYAKRDKRVTKVQNIEFDTYAPDSMEEAIAARKLLEIWTAKALLRSESKDVAQYSERQLRELGASLLEGRESVVDSLKVLGEGMEKSSRPVVIRFPYKAYHAYGDMIIHYAMSNVMSYLQNNQHLSLMDLSSRLKGRRQREWVNMGGQLMPEQDVQRLRKDIREGKLSTWKQIHKRYDDIWKRYPKDKLRHAYLSLCFIFKTKALTEQDWLRAISEEQRIQDYICSQVRLTRLKDYENPFRRATYRNEDEMIAAIGTLDDNSFVKQMNSSREENLALLESLRSRIK